MNSKKLFRIVKTKHNDEDKFIIVCGRARVCEVIFDNEEEAWDYINKMGLDWDIIVSVIGELFEIFYKSKTKGK